MIYPCFFVCVLVTACAWLDCTGFKFGGVLDISLSARDFISYLFESSGGCELNMINR